MADHVSSSKRSQIMASVKSKNTGPEHVIRKLLHAAGYRFRLHVKTLPGKPDIVLPKYKAVILVNGCFWHGHECILSKKLPETDHEFWGNKISRNRFHDKAIKKQLISADWRVCIIWECALKRKHRISDEKILRKIVSWLKSDSKQLEILGINFKK